MRAKFQVGDAVQIVAGEYAGMHGTVEKITTWGHPHRQTTKNERRRAYIIHTGARAFRIILRSDYLEAYSDVAS